MDVQGVWPIIQCWHSLTRALNEAGKPVSIEQLKSMPADQLIAMIAPLGIRFERKIGEGKI